MSLLCAARDLIAWTTRDTLARSLGALVPGSTISIIEASPRVDRVRDATPCPLFLTPWLGELVATQLTHTTLATYRVELLHIATLCTGCYLTQTTTAIATHTIQTAIRVTFCLVAGSSGMWKGITSWVAGVRVLVWQDVVHWIGLVCNRASVAD